MRCEFKCRPIPARVNVSGIRKIGNRFLIPRENSSFTLVSPLDRRRKDQRWVSPDANPGPFSREEKEEMYCYFEGIEIDEERSLSFLRFFENRSKENFTENSVDSLEAGIFKENLRKFRVTLSGLKSLD